MSADRVAAHVAAFNATVASGDWETFSQRFTDDATLAFDGVPVGPFEGRRAIAAAYVAQPPTDTMTVSAVVSDGDRDVARFAWSAGGTGTLRLTWREGEVAALTVTFDD